MSSEIAPGGGGGERTALADDGRTQGQVAGRTLGEMASSLWAKRWLTIKLALSTALAAALLSLVLPSTYEAVTTVIPVAEERLRNGLEASISAAQLSGVGSLGAFSPARYMLCPDIVRSREVLERVLAMSFPPGRRGGRVELIALVQPRGRGALRQELAVKKLRRRVDAVVDRRTGLLTIRVRSSEPEVAAGVANALVALLQEVSVRIMAGNAAENRRFIEGRLMETNRELAQAENKLRAFGESNLRIGNSPRLALELARLTRHVRAQEEIFLALTRQYELARIEEHRDVPVINVLDPAKIPASRSAPRRGLMTLTGLLLGAALGGALVLGRPRRTA